MNTYDNINSPAMRAVLEVNNMSKLRAASEACRIVLEQAERTAKVSSAFAASQLLAENSAPLSFQGTAESIIPRHISVTQNSFPYNQIQEAIHEIQKALRVSPEAVASWAKIQREFCSSASDIVRYQESVTKNYLRAIEPVRDSFARISESMLHSSRLFVDVEKAFKTHSTGLDIGTSKLMDSLSELSRTSAAVWGSFVDRPSTFTALSPYLRNAPALNTYIANIATASVAHLNEAIEHSDDTDNSLADLSDSIEARLASLDTDLIPLYRGIRKTMTARGDDYVRHFCVSGRELLTKIMHQLAPDDAVGSWTKDPIHYHNKRPTRKARLSYVYSINNMSSGIYVELTEADIDNTIALINFLHNGTHSINRPIASEQLNVLLRRIEASVSVLLAGGGF